MFSLLEKAMFRVKSSWLLKKRVCANCRFLKENSEMGCLSPNVKLDDRQRIWLGKWQKIARSLECHYDIWINKTHDKEFLKSFKCPHYRSYKKYPHATYPALEQLLRQDAEKRKWRLMFFTSLFAAIAACVTARLHMHAIDLIAKIYFWFMN